MSVHCMFCGSQANWREDAQGNSYEVEIDKFKVKGILSTRL